jgi:hypothetical protein
MQIKKMAQMNKVLSRVTIMSEADINWLELCGDLQEVELVLCDIEGGEFEIFNFFHFEQLSHCPIIIEIHDWVENSQQLIQQLIQHCSQTHTLKILKTQGRDLSGFVELLNYSDEERGLIVMEGRPRLMNWFLLTPKYQG